jgi:DNA-directed RNA polymerase specialized sigma24 family protein
VSKSLPFDVDDYDEVNRIFCRWVECGEDVDRRNIDIWTYCYVQRFFTVQFVRSSRWMRSDADRLIDVTLRRLRESRGQLRNPRLYTFWVATACRNAYSTFLRRTHFDELEDPDSVIAEPMDSNPYDLGTMYEALEAAIERLPAFLRQTARMRLVEGRTYREIAKHTGRPIPTLRSYANRAQAVLREDPQIRRVFGEIRSQA